LVAVWLLALLLFASVASAQEQRRTFRVPFHTVNGMIMLDAEVNGKPAVLLLDTGADFTLVSPQASGLSAVKLRALTATKTTGANGEYVEGPRRSAPRRTALDRTRSARHGPERREQAARRAGRWITPSLG
jgi:hypothetical protein